MFTYYFERSRNLKNRMPTKTDTRGHKRRDRVRKTEQWHIKNIRGIYGNTQCNRKNDKVLRTSQLARACSSLVKKSSNFVLFSKGLHAASCRRRPVAGPPSAYDAGCYREAVSKNERKLAVTGAHYYQNTQLFSIQPVKAKIAWPSGLLRSM